MPQPAMNITSLTTRTSNRARHKFVRSVCRWGVIGFAFCFLVCFAPEIVNSASAQDDVEMGQKALSRKSYPWYDEETDGVRRVEFGQRFDAKSANRVNVPLRPVRAPSQWPNWNWNFGSVSGWFQGLGYVAWILIGLAIAAAITLLILAFLKLNVTPDSEVDDDDLMPRRTIEESIKQLPFELDSESGDFRSLAQRSYSNGDYRLAITFLFSHVLVSLDQKGLIRLRKGKTNRQYLRELRPHRPLANYYQHVMVPFEATFFGDHDLDRPEFENCWNQLDEFQTGVDNSRQVTNAG